MSSFIVVVLLQGDFFVQISVVFGLPIIMIFTYYFYIKRKYPAVFSTPANKEDISTE
ncbi:MAG: hypothetical protein ACFFAU_14245 [Candidatus Hodarchaeota archaeon]